MISQSGSFGMLLFIWYGSKFISRFKVGSIPRMRNKEALALCIYKHAYWTEKLFILKKFEMYCSIYIEERDWWKLKYFGPTANILKNSTY